jgi:hypothetical protein
MEQSQVVQIIQRDFLRETSCTRVSDMHGKMGSLNSEHAPGYIIHLAGRVFMSMIAREALFIFGSILRIHPISVTWNVLTLKDSEGKTISGKPVQADKMSSFDF